MPAIDHNINKYGAGLHLLLTLTFFKSAAILTIYKFIRLTRVERKQYENSGSQQRSEAWWKFGMDVPSQNAFVSGWPKKACPGL
jgi:hypothetical protein